MSLSRNSQNCLRIFAFAALAGFAVQSARAATSATTTTHPAATHATKTTTLKPAATAPAPAPPVVPAGDPVQGLKIFKGTCALCHLATKDNNPSDASMRIGPNLYGVVGRPAGTLKGFRYSSAMRNSGVTWTKDQLAIYIHAPQKTIPSVRMTFKGLSNPKDAQDVIAYLDTLH
jgi:cytochrome c